MLPVNIGFDDLVTILNLKYFLKDFLNCLSDNPKDFNFVFNSKVKSLDYRIQLGPMKNIEIPKIINFNLENHIDANSTKKYSEIQKVIDDYPETSFYINIDFSIDKDFENIEISNFLDETNLAFKEITDNIINYTFAKKIK